MPLELIDLEFCEDVKRYVRSISDYEDIRPLNRKLLEVGESLKEVVVFHDASVSTIGVIVYLMVEDKNGGQHLRIVKAGTKNQAHSVPVLEHISRTYSLVLIKPLLSVTKQVGVSNFSVTLPAASNS